MNLNDRVFVGIFPCGIGYADLAVEEHGDYKKLAFLPYRTLELECYTKHAGMRKFIEEHARTVIARKGEQFEVSACGQTVLLGGG